MPSGKIFVNHALCLSCGACVGACPANAMFLWNISLEVNELLCTSCGICTQICPVSALALIQDTSEVNQ